ncbi:aquaporin [Phytoactinopolyspora halotolerans]|uniref:Aquaporin n=1 Tax=Phytoactinopolyspora halotolerans TaxID=1981512 RepID=A0A6L9S9F0_9ACTN|nr:aquaporin [Phytoactinopolyspora halotolerans]NEE01719.1 hypothetical protein [Phytoactinopolyspora halotolerans]
MPQVWARNAVAEALGAFVLTFVAILTASTDGTLTPYALSQGLAIAVLVAALGHISGGHFNPAVTLAILLNRRIDLVGASVYWAAQLAGGLLAALAVLGILSQDAVAAAAPDPSTGGDLNLAGAVALEALAVLLVVVAVFGTIVDQRAPFSAYPLAIGFSYVAGIYAIGGLTGGALNPARALGPALVGAEWAGTVAWLAGPLIGAVAAWAVYEFVIGAGMSEPAAEREPAPDVADEEELVAEEEELVIEQADRGRTSDGARLSEGDGEPEGDQGPEEEPDHDPLDEPEKLPDGEPEPDREPETEGEPEPDREPEPGREPQPPPAPASPGAPTAPGVPPPPPPPPRE